VKKHISYITRKESLSIAHKLYNPNFSHEKNLQIYDKCTNCHGHNFTLFVTIKDYIDEETGMVMNFKELKSIVRKEVYDKIDHKYLNEDIEEFKDNLMPTAENMAMVIWQWLTPKLPNLFEVKLEETDNNSTIYRGE